MTSSLGAELQPTDSRIMRSLSDHVHPHSTQTAHPQAAGKTTETDTKNKPLVWGPETDRRHYTHAKTGGSMSTDDTTGTHKPGWIDTNRKHETSLERNLKSCTHDGSCTSI
ncbi:hypothetical protein CSKR_111548 [Clonorchis sinensis]|uniref:Uncharacterized protein n=1 Tax=Clonorchis sinensis TaxID=79923 RepID=A0A3R7DDH0_CLOSI|nr:hypothetical protein CSKR_111548 [Clonorchis sinensis]